MKDEKKELFDAEQFKLLLHQSMFDAPLTYDVEQKRELLLSKLDAGEKILWYGQPDASLAERRSPRLVWYLAAIGAASIYAFVSVSADWLFCKIAFGLLAIVFAYWGYISPEFQRQVARATLYAVTTKQVVKMIATNAKNPGTKVKWMLQRNFPQHLVEPIIKPVKDSKRADIMFAVCETDNSRTEHTLDGVTDAHLAVNALNELRRSAQSAT